MIQSYHSSWYWITIWKIFLFLLIKPDQWQTMKIIVLRIGLRDAPSLQVTTKLVWHNRASHQFRVSTQTFFSQLSTQLAKVLFGDLIFLEGFNKGEYQQKPFALLQDSKYPGAAFQK